MQSNIFKYSVVVLGLAILVTLVFIYGQLMKREATSIPPTNETSSETIQSTSTTPSSSDSEVDGTAVTAIQERVDTQPTSNARPAAEPASQSPTQTTNEESLAVAEPATVAPSYNYGAMRSYTDFFYNQMSDETQAYQLQTSANQAGANENYALAIQYAEDAIAIYDTLLEKNSSHTIPDNMPSDIKNLMQDVKQTQRENIYNYREPATIILAFNKSMEDDGFPSQSEIDSYKQAKKLDQKAFSYLQNTYMPKLTELNGKVEVYKN